MAKITPQLELVDLALYHSKQNILIIGDIHIGYEESLNKQGLLIPRHHFTEIVKRLEKIFKKTGKLSKIIINGDLKHEFGSISEQEWRHTLRLLDFLSKYCDEIILIKGNHDTVLGPIADKRNVKIMDHYIICERSERTKDKKNSQIFVIHGDQIPESMDKNIKTIIIGHEHPAISLRDGPRNETFKCFMKGKWKKRILIVMPSFNLINEGTDISQEELLSPFLKNVSHFEIFVVADKIYRFGKLSNLEQAFRSHQFL
jgi:hypothetical protein